MASRFELPPTGAAAPVRFPPIVRDGLANGLMVWAIERTSLPLVSVVFVLRRGTADDPPGREGLASLTGDLLDEGAGSRDSIALAAAFARMGAHLEIDVGPDATAMSVTALSRHMAAVLDLLADVVRHPRLAADDFARVRELRLSRLRQLSRSPGTMADRAYVSALFGAHPYGHGALGTTESLDQVTPDDARGFWASMYGPTEATLIVCGDARPAEVARAAASSFGGWTAPGERPPAAAPPASAPDPRILLVHRPGAPQSELRLGHAGPPRSTTAYHALVTLNAVLGGQFTSRINRTLRQEQGVTYGAHTSFDFRRVAGTFSCEMSVQANATASAITDVLREFAEIRADEAIAPGELARAKASLTRGYVRNFETAGQLARAASQLAVHGLDDRTFDRFVPEIERVQAPDVQDAAVRFVRPGDATVVVVGDEDECRPQLESVGRPVVGVEPKF